MEPFSWTCPYCGQHTTVTEPNYSAGTEAISTTNSKHGQVALGHAAIACPNPGCKQLSLAVTLHHATWEYGICYARGNIQTWNLLPRSRAKPQPEYIPQPIRQDYEEACLILNDSPKASATMSRRCLQGIVRDYWSIPENKRGNLGAELSYIRSQVDPSTWDVITAIRDVGDIGAHMEKDVNFVVDVEPEEASLLIELIETLIADWYVARAGRIERDAKVKAMASKKLDEKKEAKKQAKASKPDAPIIEE